MCPCFSQAGPSFFLVHLQDVFLWSLRGIFDFYSAFAFSLCSVNKSSVSNRIQRHESDQDCWWPQESQIRQKFSVRITVIRRCTVTAGDQGCSWTSWLHDLHLQDLFLGWETGTEREFVPFVKSSKHHNEFRGRGSRLVISLFKEGFQILYLLRVCFPFQRESELQCRCVWDGKIAYCFLLDNVRRKIF